MTKTLPAPVRPRLGAAAAWALAAALLVAQCLGLAHGVLHAGHGEHRHAGSAVGGHAVDAHADDCDHTHTHAHGHPQSLAGLFGHADDDSAACRLLDHASVADLLVAGLAPEAPLAAAPVPLPASQFGGVSAYAGSYLARAPPKAA